MPFAVRLKKLLIDLHLYLGLVLCLFFAAWFVSGVAMMYYTTPILQPRERHALAGPLPWAKLRLEAGEAAERAGWGREPLKEARLGSLLGRPVLRAWPSAKEAAWRAVYLDDGRTVDLAPLEALSVAREALGGTWEQAGVERPPDWTKHGALDPHQKAYRLRAKDGSGRQVLISATTGEPILVTHRGFELLYFIGPVVHYYTLKSFRDFPAFWRNLVDWSSGLGAFVCLLGLVLGVWFLRWGKLPKEPAKSVPYQDTWMWLHHALGMLFGLLAFTFVLSGLFSMNPGKIFPSSSPEQVQVEAFRGGPLRAADLRGVLVLAKQAPEAFEIGFNVYQGRPLAKLWSKGSGSTGVLAWEGKRWQTAPLLDRGRVEASVQRAFPGATLSSLELLQRPDAYYYERPEKRRWRDFPVYRAKLTGASGRTLYVEPRTGEVMSAHSPGSKLRRWVYNGLHSWDFWPFYRRPFWDALLIALSLAGLSFSITGVVISWRWLAKHLKVVFK